MIISHAVKGMYGIFTRLTEWLPSNRGTLLMLDSIETCSSIMELNKCICVLDCNLSKSAVFVENMVDIPLGDLLRSKISCRVLGSA